MEYDSVKLLHKLGDEFKALKMPFKVKVLEQRENPNFAYNPGPKQYTMLIKIDSILNEEQYPCMKHFGSIEDCTPKFSVDFEEVVKDTREYFENDEDAFNFTMGLEIKASKEYKFTMNMILEEFAVNSFIEQLREATEPLRQKIYENNFNEEVDDHLTEDEYNKGTDGHK